MLLLYLFWKVYSGDWRLYVKIDEMDLKADACCLTEEEESEAAPAKTWGNLPLRALRSLF